MNSEAESSDILARIQRHLDQAFYYYEETEEFEKALLECDTAIEIDPYVADVHNLRGIVLEELGRTTEALESYEQAIRLDPDYTDAKENLSALKSELASDTHLVTIATFSHVMEAYIPKTKLDVEGIWSFVADEETVTMYWLYSNAIGGVKLQVKESDAERAIEVLNSEANGLEPIEDESSESDDAPTCPECNSANTHYETYAMRSIFGFWFFSFLSFWLIFLSVGGLDVSLTLPFLKRKWKCNNCGHAFKRERHK